MTVTEISNAGRRFSSLWLRSAIWSAIAVYLGLVILFAWNPTPFAQALAAVGIACALAHSVVTLGWRDTLAFLGICLLVSFTFENIGSSTGLLFGSYHFAVGAELRRVGVIPMIVGFLWFGMGYFSWVVAGLLLDSDAEYDAGPFARPLVAAFIMTQWDFVMDPAESTVAKAWIWHDGGAHFGVPISNYFGWLLTSFVFFQAFAIYLRAMRPPAHQPMRTSREWRLAAILFYASSGLTHLTPWLMGQSGEAIDASGQVWRVHDLRETTVAVMLLTMFFTSLLSALRLLGAARVGDQQIKPTSPPDARSAA